MLSLFLSLYIENRDFELKSRSVSSLKMQSLRGSWPQGKSDWLHVWFERLDFCSGIVNMSGSNFLRNLHILCLSCLGTTSIIIEFNHQCETGQCNAYENHNEYAANILNADSIISVRVPTANLFLFISIPPFVL